MAMAYTTARGKTKKQKESVRKDSKNNQANKLLSVLREAPKKKFYEVKDFANKQKMGIGGAEEKLQIKGTGNEKVFTDVVSAQDALMEALEKMKIYVPTYERCFYAKCHKNGVGSFKHCGKCRIARYCSADCQRADWSDVHKNACGKTESFITVGSSVAIRPTETLFNTHVSFYPKAKPPTNELHGVVISLTPQKIELFDSNLIASGQFLREISNDDIIVTQWNLEHERSFESQKKERLAELVELEKRKIRKELEKKEDEEEKKRKRAEKMALLRNLLLEKKKQEFAAQHPGEVAVDWSLFTEEINEDELLGLDDEDVEDEEPSNTINDA